RGLDDLREHMHAATAVVELAAAMVGDVDPFDAVIERDLGVFGGGDTLDDLRDLELVLDQLDGAPAQRLLEVPAAGAGAALAHIALGDIAFAPAVMGGVDGEAEGGVFRCDRPADMVLDE